MPLLKSKSSTTPAPFRVPSLAEADPSYGALVERRSELQSSHARLQAEVRELEQRLAAEPVPAFKPEVARLLGETAGAASTLGAQIRERQSQIAHHDAALRVIEQRLLDAEGAASLKVCEQSRPEYGRRVQAICRALQELDVAYQALEDLKNDFERENIRWTRLTPLLPTWAGSSKDPDSRISRYLREAKEAGYVQ